MADPSRTRERFGQPEDEDDYIERRLLGLRNIDRTLPRYIFVEPTTAPSPPARGGFRSFPGLSSKDHCGGRYVGNNFFVGYTPGDMAPPIASGSGTPVAGPHPSYIQVAHPYIFQSQIEELQLTLGVNTAREDASRIQGVQWIQDVRRALQLPSKTFATAVVYYHIFRLSHKDTEYQYIDAAAAALFCACKIEDTLKKSKEILCAAHNLKVHSSEHLSSDDPLFEGPSRIVIGVERLMYEASSFNLRSRDAHSSVISYTYGKELPRNPVANMAYSMMHDLYKTFAPLKQTSMTMSAACTRLTMFLLEKEMVPDFLFSTEGEVMETVLDLLDLYTHFQKSTVIGPQYPQETFINLRIKFNQQMINMGLPRYTEYAGDLIKNGNKSNVKTPNTPITPASPADAKVTAKDVYSPATLSPRSAGSGRLGMGARGQDGTIRFMQDASKAKEEKKVVEEYYKEEFEEYEVEVEEPIRQERGPPHNNHHHGHHHRNERYGNKRMRR